MEKEHEDVEELGRIEGVKGELSVSSGWLEGVGIAVQDDDETGVLEC